MFFQQLRTLIWRFWIVKYRHCVLTLVELLFPILVMTAYGFLYHYALPHSDTDTSKQRTETVQQLEIFGETSENSEQPPLIIYSPNNSFTRTLMANLSEDIETISCDDEECIYEAFEDKERSNATLGVHFDMDSNKFNPPYRLSYKIMVDEEQFGQALSESRYKLVDEGRPYWATGFLFVQSRINLCYLKTLYEGPGEFPAFNLSLTRLPLHRGPQNLRTWNMILIRFIGYSFTSFCPMLLRLICDDKKYKTRMMMTLTGVTDFTYYACVFISYAYLFSIITMLTTVILYFSRNVQLLNTSPVVIYITLLLYGSSFFTFCMACSAPFTSYRKATTLALVLHISILECSQLFLHIPRDKEWRVLPRTITFPEEVHLLLCLFPSYALRWIFAVIENNVLDGSPYYFGNLFLQLQEEHLITLGHLWLIMTASCIIACTCLWYFERLWPAQRDTSQPFYFPFQPSYWVGLRPNNDGLFSNLNSSRFEKDENLEPVLVVSGLYKNFHGVLSRKIIIDDLNLTVYEGEITVLLGESGAGKTTVARIIAGLLDYNKGTVLVDEYDVSYERKKAQRLIGLMVSSEALYDCLTVTEHLYLCGRLKGLKTREVKKQMVQILVLLELENKTRSQVSRLPLHTKQRCSLAIALLGSPKVLILDEPTAGLDGEERQWFYEILPKLKQKVALLVTTSSPGEAQKLGDRIVILTEGRGQCFGSLKFLGDFFGVGYHIKFKKDNNFASRTLLQLTERHLGRLKSVHENNAEVELTVDQQHATHFPKYFAELEDKKADISFKSYSVTITTLYDLYSQKIRSTTVDERSWGHVSKYATNFIAASERFKGFNLHWQQLTALMSKQFIYYKRIFPPLLAKIILPSLLLLCLITLHHILIGTLNSNRILDLPSNIRSFAHVANLSGLNDSNKLFEKVVENYEGDILDKTKLELCSLLDQTDFNEWCFRKYVVGASFDFNNHFNVTAWHNVRHQEGMPISLQRVFQAIQKAILNKKAYPEDFEMKISMLSFQTMKFYEEYVAKAELGLYIYPFGFPPFLAILTTRNMVFLLHERIAKLQLILHIAGVSHALQWLVYFLVEMIMHVCASGMVTLYIYWVETLNFSNRNSETGFALFFTAILYGFAIMPIQFALSLGFSSIRVGYVISATGALVLSLLCGGLLVVFHSLPPDLLPQWVNFTATLLFQLFPLPCASWAVKKILVRSAFRHMCATVPETQLNLWCHSSRKTLLKQNGLYRCCKPRSLFNWTVDGINIELLLLVAQGIFYFTLLAVFETASLQIMKNREVSSSNDGRKETDDDVARDAEYVKVLYTGHSLAEGIIIARLSKRFRKVTAVDNVSLAIKKGEIFAIFGMNGVGKTVLLRMLATDIIPSAGDVLVENNSLAKDIRKYRQSIGYCPQQDSLFERLTGREILHFIGSVRGLDEDVLGKHNQFLLGILRLVEIADKQIITYNRSSRRKLAVALAFVGFPKVVLLDEPMSGVDSAARRCVQETLRTIRGLTQCTVVLTCSRVDDCESLCDRLTLMVGGRLRCLGSTEHLVRKFVKGITIVVKLPHNEESNDLSDDNAYYMSKVVSPGVITSRQKQEMHYYISSMPPTWSVLFARMEQMKKERNLEDYWITNVTLEHIFLYMNTSRNIKA